jgi:hypothetical protein
LVGKLEGESLLGRPKCRWKGVKTDLKEIGWQVGGERVVNRIHLADWLGRGKGKSKVHSRTGHEGPEGE